MNLHIDNDVDEILKILSEKLLRNNSLNELVDLYKSHSLKIKVGAEIEFYNIENRELYNYDVKSERGKDQFEINIEPSNPCDAVLDIKNCIEILAQKSGILLSPKPFKNDYGSSIQINISIWNVEGCNIFNNKDIIDKSCNTLCSYMLDSFLIFAPAEECYDRFQTNFMAPVNVSKGNNNRSTAIRIPNIGEKRIEYRLGAHPADPHVMTYILLKQLAEYIIYKNESQKYEVIFGDASDKQYNLESFPKNLEEAKKILVKSAFINSLF